MKKVLCVIMAVCSVFMISAAAWGSVAIDEEHFPDPNFRNYLASNYDSDSDGTLSDSELSINLLDVSGHSISSLQGVEYFTSLRWLNCEENNLTELDVSSITTLEGLYCNSNDLTELDITHNTALTQIQCRENALTELDVSQNTLLYEIDCRDNYLTKLDLTANTALTTLYCHNNRLEELDLSNNTLLTMLNCQGNRLTELDVSNNTALTNLYCHLNNISSLDVSNNIALTALQCYGNRIAALDVNHNANLTELMCQAQAITASIDLSDGSTGSYSFDLSSLSSSLDMNYVQDVVISDSSDAEISHSTVDSTLYFSSSRVPATISYQYDPRFSANSSNYMDVTVTLSGDYGTDDEDSNNSSGNNSNSSGNSSEAEDAALTLSVAPSTQTVTYGSSITPISITATNLSGDLVWSFRVSGDYALGLTSSDRAISGTISSNVSEDTYTIIITAWDSRATTVTTSVTITVSVPQNPDSPDNPSTTTGITGVEFTDPSSKAITIPAAGGTFTATATALGTASGDVVWGVSVPEYENLSAEISVSGSTTAQLTVTVAPNTTAQVLSYIAGVTAHDDVGQVYADSIAITVSASIQAQQNTSGNNTESNTNSYRFTMSSGLMNGILRAFSGMTESSVYQLSDSEILSGTWELGNDDLQALAQLNEQAVLNIPAIRPANTGVYTMRLNLSGTAAGTKIALHAVSSSSAGSVNAGALEDMDYTFFDADGNVIDTVPSDGIVYAAMNLTAGNEVRGVVTSQSSGSTSVYQGTVTPLNLTDDEQEQLVENIIEALSDTVTLDAEDIKFISTDNILPAADPTNEMVETVKKDNYEIVGKLNTISIDEPGWYVMRVELSDDLFNQVYSLDVNSIAMYAFSADVNPQAQSVTFRSAFLINGLLGTWEILSMSGQKIQKFGVREFLMVGFLDAGTPFTLFVAKAILALFTGGLGAFCSAGSYGAALAVIFIIMRRIR